MFKCTLHIYVVFIKNEQNNIFLFAVLHVTVVNAWSFASKPNISVIVNGDNRVTDVNGMISYESCSKDMVTFELNKEEIDENIFCVENTESIQTIQLQAGVNAAVILLKPKTGIILSLEQKIKLRAQLFIHTLLNTHNKYF